ncbi:hypothetical protein RHSIM_Rhsim07G0113800 [Rhododendron simsii]|uniref:Uncharacterized protein n=1 Tax=Rhododendron simsii TaxID=118357 RepID=A0A834LH36_RHOSS|nr:hypothetical protein RHSIM_Rhsim07G0113800 [Rhododendron simsii]
MPTPEHPVFDFDLIKAVFCFLYLHYLGNGNASPFEAHPVAMGVAFANLLLHCISYELEQRVTRVGRGGMGLFRWILFCCGAGSVGGYGSPPLSSNMLDQLAVVRKAHLCRQGKPSPTLPLFFISSPVSSPRKILEM